jgi:type IV fimbrial biogenesis protein FimT
MNTHKLKFSTGFTLTELMITIAIMGIAMSVAIPSFNELIVNTRLVGAANTLIGALQLTRSEAIKRLKPVYLKPKSGNDWTSGWTVQVDNNTVVREFDALKNVTAIGFNNIPAQGIEYLPSGRVLGGNNSTLSLCSDADSNSFRNIIIAPTGRVSIQSQKDTSSPCP